MVRLRKKEIAWGIESDSWMGWGGTAQSAGVELQSPGREDLSGEIREKIHGKEKHAEN